MLCYYQQQQIDKELLKLNKRVKSKHTAELNLLKEIRHVAANCLTVYIVLLFIGGKYIYFY